MKGSVTSIIIGFFLVTSHVSLAQDTLKSPLKISPFLAGDVSNIGFYGGVGTQFIHNKLGFSLAYLVDYSDAELPANGPFGFNIAVRYYYVLPNKKIITPFINADYRMMFHKRHCVYDCSKKYNKTHEFTVGYGISLKIFEHLSLSNAINVGWYSERLYSDRTGKTISNSGVNTLVQTRLNFQF